MSDLIKSSYWDKPALLTRIADPKARIRYEAGSPNTEEIKTYYESLILGFNSEDLTNKHIFLLGMTPELRTMALEHGAYITSIDKNQDAIDTYTEWVPYEFQANEKIIHASWWDANKHVKSPVHAILGDGVFGNVLSVEKHMELLQLLKVILAENGILVFRKAMLPNDFEPDSYDANLLIDKYRSGTMSDAEFGFSMRLWGNYKNAYNPQNFLLDNRITFKQYHEWMKEGKLTEFEYGCICHYYFNGLNMILSQHKWEELLKTADLNYTRHQLKGKDWYSYYPIYVCNM